MTLDSAALGIVGPALAAGLLVTATHVPFGIQVTGPRFADDLVLAMGSAWEEARPWPIVAPGFTPFGE